jgi:hypothetical protein
VVEIPAPHESLPAVFEASPAPLTATHPLDDTPAPHDVLPPVFEASPCPLIA